MNHLESVTPKRNKWWWYLLVFISFPIVSNITGFVIFGILYIFRTNRIEKWHVYMTGLHKNDNFMLAIGLFMFVIVLAWLIFLIKKIHGRKWTEIINGTNHIRWSRFFHGFAFWGGMVLVGYLIDYISAPKDFVWQFNLEKFVPSFFISIILIPVQASCEEFIFRGYLAQGFASWTKSRWCALIFPSILFALMHSLNPECAGYGYGIMMA